MKIFTEKEFKPIEGAPQTYPLWDKITQKVIDESENERKLFLDKKAENGFFILSANQVYKDETYYWVMFDDFYDFYLVPYATGVYPKGGC